MRLHNRHGRAFLLVTAFALIGACAGEDTSDGETGSTTSTDGEEPIVLSYATSLGKDSAYYQGALALQEAADELSDGRLQIEIFPDAQLGDDRDMIEGMQLGAIDLASPSTGAMGAVVPEATVLDLPYLFDDYDHAHRVLDGPIAEDLHSLFDGVGFHPLGYWEIGFRHLTNNVGPVHEPADVDGLTLRTLPSEVHQKAWELVGARPQAMDFTEVYNALDTGVVDGQENPFNIILTGNLQEVQAHLSLTQHVYGAAPTSVSDATWESLPSDLQEALREAVARSVVAQREAASGDEDAQLQELKDSGIDVVEEPDHAAFREAMSPAWALYTDRFGDAGQELIDKIRAEAEN